MRAPVRSAARSVRGNVWVEGSKYAALVRETSEENESKRKQYKREALFSICPDQLAALARGGLAWISACRRQLLVLKVEEG